MKTEGAKNHWARLDCHKLMKFATYNGQSISSKNHLHELEEELVRINWDKDYVDYEEKMERRLIWSANMYYTTETNKMEKTSVVECQIKTSR